MVRPSYVRKLRFIDVGFWFVIMRYFVLLNNYLILVLQKHVFLLKLDIRHFLVLSAEVWKVLHSYFAPCFVNLLYFFLRQNYVINAFLIMIYFMTLGLRYENYVLFLFGVVTFFISSQLGYLFVWCSYVF